MNELSLYILDIMENSLHASSKKIILNITEDSKTNVLKIEIIDDGCGMDEEILKKVSNPFYTSRTTRKVGLGIPLFKELCELCEGSFQMKSKKGVGTHLLGTMKLNSIDILPLGNMPDTMCILASNTFNTDIIYKHIKDDKEFIFNTIEIKEALGPVPLTDVSVVVWMKEYIKEGLNNLI